ncbi:WxL domain-containing protein [Enterococcus sp. DIV0876]|uniref:WxL domain-containing protein n=1 Tax=Enterococcus sp. DIV0876 TaxID=2774633 RepID=UPI003D2F9CA0
MKKKQLSVLLLTAVILGSNLTSVPAYADIESNIGTIEFGLAEDNTDVTDPDGENNIDIPTKPGEFVIAYAPNFYFGENEISALTTQYPADADEFAEIEDGVLTGQTIKRAHHAQVRDLRGSGSGWTLSLAMSSDGFTNANDHKILGTKLLLNAPISNVNAAAVTLNPGESVSAMSALPGTGEGLSTVMWGTTDALENGKNPSILLEIPGNSGIQAETEYTATLTWTLAATPANP